MVGVRITWRNNPEQRLVIEVESDQERPDILDDMSSRALHLLRESLGAVFGIEAEPKTEV